VFDGTDSCVTPVIPLSPDNKGPIARLSASPSLEIGDAQINLLTAGTGSKEILENWVGWTEGKDYSLDEQGTVHVEKRAKL
jgi:hypothetical protein